MGASSNRLSRTTQILIKTSLRVKEDIILGQNVYVFGVLKGALATGMTQSLAYPAKVQQTQYSTVQRDMLRAKIFMTTDNAYG